MIMSTMPVLDSLTAVRERIRVVRDIMSDRKIVNDGALRNLLNMYRTTPAAERDLGYRIAFAAALREAARRRV
jgi:hypothetical protein